MCRLPHPAARRMALEALRNRLHRAVALEQVIAGNVAIDDGAGGDHRALADDDAGQDDGIGPDAGPVADPDRDKSGLQLREIKTALVVRGQRSLQTVTFGPMKTSSPISKPGPMATPCEMMQRSPNTGPSSVAPLATLQSAPSRAPRITLANCQTRVRGPIVAPSISRRSRESSVDDSFIRCAARAGRRSACRAGRWCRRRRRRQQVMQSKPLLMSRSSALMSAITIAACSARSELVQVPLWC
jgi:hypothetical protein